MPSPQPRTTSERSDDIPLIIHWLLQLNLCEILDAALPSPHGNRQGLSQDLEGYCSNPLIE